MHFKYYRLFIFLIPTLSFSMARLHKKEISPTAYIKFNTEKLRISITEYSTIDYVKDEIFKRTGIKAEEQRLYTYKIICFICYKRKELNGSSKLIDEVETYYPKLILTHHIND